MSSQTFYRQQSSQDTGIVNGLNVGVSGITTTGALSAVGNVQTLGQLGCVSEVINATSFVAPSTALGNTVLTTVASTGGGTAGTPYFNVAVNSTNPNLASGNALVAYATTAATAPAPGTSLLVTRSSVNSLPLNDPAGASGTFTGTGAVVAVAVATITAGSQVQVWLLGASAAAFTAGITAPVIAVTATGFTHNAVNGAIYGYQVLYA